MEEEDEPASHGSPAKQLLRQS